MIVGEELKTESPWISSKVWTYAAEDPTESCTVCHSVVHPDPYDPFDFEPPGSGSVIILYGSGSHPSTSKKGKKIGNFGKILILLASCQPLTKKSESVSGAGSGSESVSQ
jgi:hypothetical protein